MTNGKNNNRAAKDMKIEANLILDCLDFEIMVISEDFEIIFANKYYLSANNLTLKDAVGKHCYALTHRIDHPCVPPDDPCPIERVRKTGKPEAELHIHHPRKGEKKKVYVTAALAEDKSLGYIHLTLPAMENVDSEKNIEQALTKTIDVLKVVNLYQRQIKDLKTKTVVLQETKQQLEKKIKELENFNKFIVGRELKMVALKSKIRELEQQRVYLKSA